MDLFFPTVFLMGWRTGSEEWRDDLREETNCRSSSDADSEGATENVVLEEERDFGAVPTEAVFLARVLLATGSSSLISTKQEGWAMVGDGLTQVRPGEGAEGVTHPPTPVPMTTRHRRLEGTGETAAGQQVQGQGGRDPAHLPNLRES